MKIILSSILLAICVTTAHTETLLRPTPLRVVSYNIHHGQGMDGEHDLVRIAKVIAMQKPDLVALQEVDRNCKRSGKVDQAAQLAKLLGMELRFGKTINIGKGEYGNAVLSKLPISKTLIHPLPKGGEPRIALEVVVQRGKELLSFFSLHLERNVGNTRQEQAKALLKIASKRTHPVILAGDFNAARDSEPMKNIAASDWIVLKKNDGQSIRTFHGEKHRKDSNTPARVEIDYLVIRGFKQKPGLKILHGVVPELVASDHRPLYAEFAIAAVPPEDNSKKLTRPKETP